MILFAELLWSDVQTVLEPAVNSAHTVWLCCREVRDMLECPVQSETQYPQASFSRVINSTKGAQNLNAKQCWSKGQLMAKMVVIWIVFSAAYASVPHSAPGLALLSATVLLNTVQCHSAPAEDGFIAHRQISILLDMLWPKLDMKSMEHSSQIRQPKIIPNPLLFRGM